MSSSMGSKNGRIFGSIIDIIEEKMALGKEINLSNQISIIKSLY